MTSTLCAARYMRCTRCAEGLLGPGTCAMLASIWLSAVWSESLCHARLN